MQYFKIAQGQFIEYNELTNKATILIKAELIDEKQYLQDRIAEGDPNQPTTNAEWVVWAKEHYPYVDHSAEISRLNEVQAILDIIKDL